MALHPTTFKAISRGVWRNQNPRQFSLSQVWWNDCRSDRALHFHIRFSLISLRLWIVLILSKQSTLQAQLGRCRWKPKNPIGKLGNPHPLPRSDWRINFKFLLISSGSLQHPTPRLKFCWLGLRDLGASSVLLLAPFLLKRSFKYSYSRYTLVIVS